MGRRYTWSNHQGVPTLERLDRVFGTVDWFDRFQNHCLKGLSSDCSDHCLLLLLLSVGAGPKRRFMFENFWTKLLGFMQTVQSSWETLLVNVDPCKKLDIRLRDLAKCLQSWSSR